MALRFPLLITLVILITRVDCAAGASTVDRELPDPITVALVPAEALPDWKDTSCEVPDGALGRAVKWIELRGLQDNNSPNETDLFADAADGSLDEHRLIEAALIAEGIVDPFKRAEYLDKFDEAFERLSNIINASASEAERAGGLLGFLHRELFFGGYRVDCTRLSEVVASGEFNCASATIVFCAFAERLGLETVAIEVPGHVLCSLSVGKDRLDVETTCAGWLTSPNRKTSRNHFVYNASLPSQIEKQALGTLGINRPSAMAQHSRSPQLRDSRHFGPPSTNSVVWRQELPVSALVAIIYYNRGLDELDRQKYADAAVANVNALRINPNSPAAWSNLLATVNNWALDANQQSDYSQAIALLREGIELAPDHKLFQTNLETVKLRSRSASRL